MSCGFDDHSSLSFVPILRTPPVWTVTLGCIAHDEHVVSLTTKTVVVDSNAIGSAKFLVGKEIRNKHTTTVKIIELFFFV